MHVDREPGSEDRSRGIIGRKLRLPRSLCTLFAPLASSLHFIDSALTLALATFYVWSTAYLEALHTAVAVSCSNIMPDDTKFYSSSPEVLLNPVVISRNENEKVLIEGSVNSVLTPTNDLFLTSLAPIPLVVH